MKKQNNNLIAISGKLGSGKDEVASMINDLVKSHYEVKKFAGKLKDIVCLLLGCTREDLEDRDFKNTELSKDWWYYLSPANKMISYKEKYIIDGKDCPLPASDLVKLTPRLLLQLLGTECGRNIIHPNIWCNSLFAEYRPLDDSKRANLGNVIDYSDCEFPNWLISDIRFSNEAIALKERGGVIIRINRPRVGIEHMNDGSKRLAQNPIEEHESETGLDDYKDFDFVIENDGTLEDLKEKVKTIVKSLNIEL